MKNISYILFDGDCVLCSSFIRFIDKNYNNINKTYITSNPSKFPARKGNADEIKKLSSSTIIFLDEKKNYKIKSSAIIEILKRTNNFFLNAAALLLKILPISLRDFMYEFFAKYRRAIFNKKICEISSLKNLELII